MKNLIINKGESIREAIKKMDKNGIGFICVTDDELNVVGILTDGDFRRAILKGVDLENKIIKISNQNFVSAEINTTNEEIKEIFAKNRINRLPLLNNGKLVEILLKENYIKEKNIINHSDKPKKSLPVVIMAGGKGTRMKPFTNILPKPLIPIGDKSMIEKIMDEYSIFFNSEFYISVNYKANIIKAYLEDFKDKYKMYYIEEDKPLGTGGALKFLEKKIKTPFFVSNCDILIKADYGAILNHHVKNCFDITIVASMIHHQIPYGVCELNTQGELLKLTEKPEYDFLINTGMYVINPKVLKYIPANQLYHITDLINTVKENKGKIGIFPVSEKSYLDVGQWKEYSDTVNFLKNNFD